MTWIKSAKGTFYRADTVVRVNAGGSVEGQAGYWVRAYVNQPGATAFDVDGGHYTTLPEAEAAVEDFLLRLAVTF